MKIGITADFHLTLTDAHPERKNALLDILQQCRKLDVQQLIIAGDLFDAPMSTYSEFEDICKRSEFSKIQLLIIPGNHDANISNKQIVAKNIRVFDQPVREQLAGGWDACLIPYRENQTMGKAIGEIPEKEYSGRWTLVGHGDWFGSLNVPNPYEGARTYMPLTRKEVDLRKPDFVFLGHLHAPQKMGKVFYTGSPCPVTVNETGYRRFLILDTDTGGIEESRVNNNVIYFAARLIVMPSKDEQGLISRQIEQYKRDWSVNESDLRQIKIQATAVGYSDDRGAIVKAIKNGFAEFEFLEDPDISQVKVANDVERNFIIERIQRELDDVDYPIGKEGEPDKEQILFRAMDLVYGRI